MSTMKFITGSHQSLAPCAVVKLPERRDTETTLDLSELDELDDYLDEDDQLDELIVAITQEVKRTLVIEHQRKSGPYPLGLPSSLDFEKAADGIVASTVDKVITERRKLMYPKGSMTKTLDLSSHSATSVSSSASDSQDNNVANKYMGVAHPDFWCADVFDLDVSEHGEMLTLLSRSGDSKSVSTNSTDSNTFDEADEGDDCSVCSDISGLTGVFPTGERLNRLSITSCPEGTQVKMDKVILKDVSVRFGTIQVREYPRILGDNPACSSGPSLSIDWDYHELPALQVDDFERIRKSARRPVKNLILSREKREKMLRRQGHSSNDIAEGTRRNNKGRALRRQTVNNLTKDKTVMHTAARKMMLLLRKSK